MDGMMIFFSLQIVRLLRDRPAVGLKFKDNGDL